MGETMLLIDRDDTTTQGPYGPSKVARLACAVCGGQLQIWTRHDEAHPGKLNYYVVCIRDKSHEGIKQRRTQRNAWKEGEVVYPAAAALYEREAEEEAKRRFDMTQEIQIRPEMGMDRAKALERLQLAWPKAPAPVVEMGAVLCATYGLDPFLGDLYLVEFGGKWTPVLGRGYDAKAHKRAGLIPVDGPRMATKDERADYGAEDNQLLAVYRCKAPDGGIYLGYGVFKKGTAVFGEDKGNTAQNMAMKRAFRSAIKQAAPMEIPGLPFEDEAANGSTRIVDIQTGEVHEAEGAVDTEVNNGERPGGSSASEPPSQAKKITLAEARDRYHSLLLKAKEIGIEFEFAPQDIDNANGETLITWGKAVKLAIEAKKAARSEQLFPVEEG